MNLPPELLAEIFYWIALHCSSVKDITRFCYSFLSLTWVCRLWRNVALGTPSMWSWITVPRSLEFTKELIARSKNCPITVDATFYEKGMGRDVIRPLKVVLSHMSQIQHIRLSLPYDHIAKFSSAFSQPAPLLNIARFSTPFVLRDDKPLLTNLTFEAGHLRAIMPFFQSPVRHVTLIHCADASEGLKLADFLNALGRMHHLETLTMNESICAAKGVESIPTIHLPSLKRLQITSDAQTILWFLRHVIVPKSTLFDISINGSKGDAKATSDVLIEIKRRIASYAEYLDTISFIWIKPAMFGGCYLVLEGSNSSSGSQISGIPTEGLACARTMLPFFSMNSLFNEDSTVMRDPFITDQKFGAVGFQPIFDSHEFEDSFAIRQQLNMLSIRHLDLSSNLVIFKPDFSDIRQVVGNFWNTQKSRNIILNSNFHISLETLALITTRLRKGLK
ncbi:hypothetical protein C8Q75DRAFT_811418 [Abortiporus biennis]|nr:hypothetical protein C8Q75DRAFT_811418 [Abortiporus biennis]